MNKLFITICALIIFGCCEPLLLLAYASMPADQYGLNSFADVTEFGAFKVGMNENELKSIVDKQHLLSKYYEIGGRSFYHVYRADGENVMIMFRNEECSRIQHMPVDPYCGLYFLADTPEFQTLTLTTSESDLNGMIEQYHFLKIISGSREIRIIRVYRQDGENVIVKFRYGKCSGVQRMPRDSETVALAGKV